MLDLRQAVGPELERLRVSGAVGSSLDAELDLYVSPELALALGRLADELRYVFITSEVRIHPLADRPDTAVATERPDLLVMVEASTTRNVRAAGITGLRSAPWPLTRIFVGAVWLPLPGCPKLGDMLDVALPSDCLGGFRARSME